MNPIEFPPTVENGAIKIPLEHQPTLQGGVTVIVVPDDRPAATPSLIDHLLAQPLRVAGFKPLTRKESHDRCVCSERAECGRRYGHPDLRAL